MEASNQDSLRVQDREQPWLGFQAGEGSRGQSGRRGPQTWGLEQAGVAEADCEW